MLLFHIVFCKLQSCLTVLVSIFNSVIIIMLVVLGGKTIVCEYWIFAVIHLHFVKIWIFYMAQNAMHIVVENLFFVVALLNSGRASSYLERFCVRLRGLIPTPSWRCCWEPKKVSLSIGQGVSNIMSPQCLCICSWKLCI
jgi:hypothetical protein